MTRWQPKQPKSFHTRGLFAAIARATRLCLLFAFLACGCTTGATEMIVDLDTDIPRDRTVSLAVTVVYGARAASDAAVDLHGMHGHVWVRAASAADGGARDVAGIRDATLMFDVQTSDAQTGDATGIDAGFSDAAGFDATTDIANTADAVRQLAGDPITFPSSFAVTRSSENSIDEAVELTLVANVGPGIDGAPALQVTRVVRFQFTQGRTGHLPVFIAVACGAPAIGCHHAPGNHCTLSELCSERGMTCGNNGGCVPVETAPGIDAASPVSDAHDAGRDAPTDQGAAPPPRCTLTVDPTIGGLGTDFTLHWTSSDTDTCSYRLDSPDWSPAPPPCSGDTTFQGPSVGTHTIDARVTGPGGESECSTTWTVVPPPTCTLTFTPDQIGIATPTHIVLHASDTTSCTYDVNGGIPSAPLSPCQMDSTAPLSTDAMPLPAGGYVTTVHLIGPGGTGTCSAVLTALPRPSCTLTLIPNPVVRGSSYRAVLASMNATTCSISGASVPCNVDQSFVAMVDGTTAVTVDELGDGGDGSCSATLVVVPPPPTCVLTVTPTSGPTTATFNFALTSTDATTCQAMLDSAGTWSPVACSSTATPLSGFAAGPHHVDIQATGAGGTGSCSTDWSVF